MQVKIQVQSFESCGLSYIPIFQFCAGNPQLGKDTCNGDRLAYFLNVNKLIYLQ